MVRSAKIYVEGGGDSSKLHDRCREGFSSLFKKCGLATRMPRIVGCGSRAEAFDKFKTALLDGREAYIALLVDSEDPVDDIEKTWAHLKKRDDWDKPSGTDDANVLLMTTCMETWIVADQKAITQHFDPRNQKSVAFKGLPTSNLETRLRHAVQDALVIATKNCTASYAKGKRSFEVLAKLDPKTLSEKLPSFARVVRILNEKL
jgi:hypothetical protein